MGIFKDENGNSYGDWTHRGQGRTRENANDIVTTGDEKKWYDQTFWIIFFLVVLWPVGLVLMWRGACTWHVAVKIVVTIVLVGVVALSYQMSQAVMAAQGTMGYSRRPGVGTGLSPVLKQWLARLHRPLGCSVRCATCARRPPPSPAPDERNNHGSR